MIPLNVLEFENLFILDQLKLEEYLLHDKQENYLLINFGSNPAIVLGIGQKKEDFVNRSLIEKNPLPIIRRFSGGGAVIVDEETIFITWILAKETINNETGFLPLFPETIHQTIFSFYTKIFPIEGFALKENDYVIEYKKCGGNAQYIKKDRFLHHTSFLWDYKKEHMDYLLLPKKAPYYRQNRSHEDFLTVLNPHFENKTFFKNSIHIFLYNNFLIKHLQKNSLVEEVQKRKPFSYLENGR